jgi:hypothetical protein
MVYNKDTFQENPKVSLILNFQKFEQKTYLAFADHWLFYVQRPQRYYEHTGRRLFYILTATNLLYSIGYFLLKDNRGSKSNFCSPKIIE